MSKSILKFRDVARRRAFQEVWAGAAAGIWVVLLLLSGCGYRPVTLSLPADRTLALSTFDAQIADATVATAVTGGVREALLSRGWPIVSPADHPGAEIVGRVVRYERTPTALDLPGRAQGYRLSITLAYRLRRGDRLLPERQVVGRSEYAVSANATRGQTAERQAVREAARQAGEALADALPVLWEESLSPTLAPLLSPSPPSP